MKKNYKDNERWINTLFDIYGENLLSQTKQPRYRITREKILECIGVTEEDLPKGLTFQQIERFFSSYNIPFYAYGENYSLLYSYVPEKPSHHYPILYCICKNEHVYICNYNVKELQQLKQLEEPSTHVSNHFRLPKDEPFVPFQMIGGLTDLLKKVQRAAANNITQLNLIHYDNDLVHITVRLTQEAYHPKICFNAGDITAIFLRFQCHNSEVEVMIRTQRPVVDSMDTTIIVDTAEEFNNQYLAKQQVYLQLFKREYLSANSNHDIEILNSCRTVANTCTLRMLQKKVKTAGVDLIKAHTSFLQNITEVPVFNEFDSFKPYDGSKIEPLSFYVVEAAEKDLFFNARYNIVIGSILQEELNYNKSIKIIQYNRPSNIKQVDFKK